MRGLPVLKNVICGYGNHMWHIEFITLGLWPLVKNSMCSLVITITTHDIFQYLKANWLALYHDQCKSNKPTVH